MPGTMPPGGSTSKPDFRSRFLQSVHTRGLGRFGHKHGISLHMAGACTATPLMTAAWRQHSAA